MKELIGKITQKDVIKAMKRGSREADFEVSAGWVAKDRPHKNKRKYNRKSQEHLNSWDFKLKYVSTTVNNIHPVWASPSPASF
jgi:hypothetical protein